MLNDGSALEARCGLHQLATHFFLAQCKCEAKRRHGLQAFLDAFGLRLRYLHLLRKASLQRVDAANGIRNCERAVLACCAELEQVTQRSELLVEE